ncbi:MAG: DUF3857 domain-containing protein [Saprospiraceae bacterium]
MKQTILTTIALCFWASAIFSQQIYKLEKWGKIPEADLQMTHCSFDSSAASMVLQESGNYELTRTVDGWRVRFIYQNRIKIFDESALDQGNLRIYFRADRDVEKLMDLDAQIILSNGDVQKVKSDNVFTEQVNKSVSAKKVFIPNLQKGCIIEYRYELESAYIYSLYETWYFQQEMPVRWSQVTVTLPQYFTYVYLMQAPRKFDLNEQRQDRVTPPSGAAYLAATSTYGLANLPAIRDEPYITTLNDYRAHIGFQLSEIYFPGQAVQKVMTSWPELAEEMIKNENFGEQYLKGKRFDKLWAAFRAEVPEGTAQEELPEKVLRFVSTHIKWNGENRRYSESGLDAAFTKKTGSTADLNLALVALLRKLGFDAVPMLISTRQHGAMFNVYPFSDQFNTVVAFLYKGDSGILLDATNPLRAFGQMRGECYNGQGWLVDEKRPNWVEIGPPEYSETWFSNMKINEEGEMSGHMTMLLGGPAATTWRSDLEGAKEADFLKEQFASSYAERSFDSITMTDIKAFDKPLKVDFYCKIPNAATPVNDFLYLKPVLDFFIMENPLKSIKRSFPVNLTYPIKAQYVLNLELPQGYSLEEIPPPARIILPDNGGKIQFSCGKISNSQVQVVLKANLAQLKFLPEEYEALRQFFELMADKAQFQLALKKT